MTELLAQTAPKKYAILSMDVEDWYHSDYFIDKKLDRSYSMLDGLDRYVGMLQDLQIPSSFFVLSDLAKSLQSKMLELSSCGYELACHGDDHTRPLLIPSKDFYIRTVAAKKKIEDLTGLSVAGYRAPSFSLDRERLDMIRKAGFLYDSSKNAFSDHPLYGCIDISGFDKVVPNIYRAENFFEFEVSTLKIADKNIPVSGGGYLRILPWWLTSNLITRYLKDASFYVLFIHPFELSHRAAPYLDNTVSFPTRMRFSLGRSTTEIKLRKVISLLKKEDFCFTTFSDLRQILK